MAIPNVSELVLETERIQCLDGRNRDYGRWYLQYSVTLKVRCIAHGQLTFAVWQVWEDQPETHEPTKQKILNNARTVLQTIAQENKPV